MVNSPSFIDLKQACVNDLPRIMHFIKKYWKENHILGSNKEFFIYEHQNNKKLNFYIAEEKKTKKVVAIQGFIPYGEPPNCHICGVISKVHPENRVPLIGIQLMKKMLDDLTPKTYCGIGTNPKTMVPLVKKFFNRNTGVMDHFFIPNYQKKEFTLLTSFHPIHHAPKRDKKNTGLKTNNFVELSKKEFKRNFHKIKINKNLPIKTLPYLLKRYFDHTIYNYKCTAIFRNRNQNIDIIFTREIFIKKLSVLRIIDFMGDINTLGMIGNWFETMLKNFGYEYVDLLCSGINNNLLEDSGFINRRKFRDIVVPTYFEPLIEENIDIYYEKSDEDLIIFKGDADADRPNFW